MNEWNKVKPAMCAKWLVLPTVYSDALSYGEQLDKFCYQLNKIIENNNILPDYISEMIQSYISSGAIGEVVREILANYILNVKYPPEGIKPAVGDGSEDDTEAIQGCIDYASKNGGVVYFPYGSYLTQPLTMKNGVSLFGFDRYSAKIVLKGGATKALLNGNGNDISVCNLTLDGNSGIQVNDVNVVDMTGSNLMFNDLIIKDGYKLFNFVGDGHLQLNNIVFGDAVENCFSVDGNVIVQTNNLLFTALSKIGGISVIDIKANGGNYDIHSVAKCNTCMRISGNDNKVVALIGGATEDYVDTGEHNNIEIAGHSNKEYYSGDIKIDANNYETTLQGTKSLHVVGATTEAYDSNYTESIDGNKSTVVTGTTTETYKEQKTVNATNVVENITKKVINSTDLIVNTDEPITYKKPTPTKFYDTVPLKDSDSNVYNIIVENDYIKNKTNRVVIVSNYGAKGDGITDDYESFVKAINDTNDGDIILIPNGVYYLSKNPYPISDNIISTDYTKFTHGFRRFLISNATFTGAGIGAPNVGKGKFASPFITNPWLIVAGDNILYNLNGINEKLAENGAIIGDSKELTPINTDTNGLTHKWFSLEYRGANTGNADNPNASVEILNQVLNITGCKGIATEIDLNSYSKASGFSVGLFITGGGVANNDMTAIDINRDENSNNWVNGISIGKADVGLYVKNDTCKIGFLYGTVNRKSDPGVAIKQRKNGNDGIVIERATDVSPTGNMIVIWNAAENDELFAVGASGDVRCKSLTVNGAPVKGVNSKEYTTNTQTWTVGEHTLNFSQSGNYIGTVDLATVGFVSSINVINHTTNSITVYVATGGTGAIKYTVLSQ